MTGRVAEEGSRLRTAAVEAEAILPLPSVVVGVAVVVAPFPSQIVHLSVIRHHYSRHAGSHSRSHPRTPAFLTALVDCVAVGVVAALLELGDSSSASSSLVVVVVTAMTMAGVVVAVILASPLGRLRRCEHISL